jgi:hypothetical protein
MNLIIHPLNFSKLLFRTFRTLLADIPRSPAFFDSIVASLITLEVISLAIEYEDGERMRIDRLVSGEGEGEGVKTYSCMNSM